LLTYLLTYLLWQPYYYQELHESGTMHGCDKSMTKIQKDFFVLAFRLLWLFG